MNRRIPLCRRPPESCRANLVRLASRPAALDGRVGHARSLAVQAQVDDLALEVEKYRDHPALLAWGVGNELEHVNEEADSDTTAIILMWRAINLTAQMVKSLDPHHPTISVTADLGEWHLVDNATQLATWCDAIDIWGINAYETLGDLRAKVDAGPWDRPYLIPEYGQIGRAHV